MKFRSTLTFQLGTIIAGILIISIIISSIATYITAYNKLYEAAGVEAYGCANITTGLIEPEQMEKALAGDEQARTELGKELNWTTNHKDIFETQYILDLDGNIIALDDNLASDGFKPGDKFYIDKDAISMLLKMKHPTYSKTYKFANMERLSGYAPIFEDQDPSKDVIAVSVIDFNADIVSERTWDVVSKGILISLIPILLAAIITAFLIRRKTKPISQLICQAKEIANGNLQVEETVVKSHDEIGELSKTLNLMTHNLRNMISTMRSTSIKLTESTEDTANSLNFMNNAAQSVANHISNVNDSMKKGIHHAENASNVLHTLASDLQQMKKDVDVTVDQSKQTMNIAQSGELRAREISNDMEIIKQGSQEVNNSIQQLVQNTTQIQDLTTTISNIAAETNLLALNASIEAARAGEHGKGFTVVAEEVRKLAEQSNEEVSKVELQVKEIMEQIKKVLISSSESTKHIEKGEKTVQLTVKSLKDISDAIRSTVSVILQFSDEITTQIKNADEIVRMIQEFTQSIHGIEKSMNDITDMTNKTTTNINEVSDHSIELSNMANELEHYVKSFQLKD